MSIVFDKDLGTKSVNGNTNGTPVVLTTTATAAANTRIFVLVSWFTPSSQTITGITATGGLTFAVDKAVINGSDRFSIWSVDCPGGLASGSSISVAFSSSVSLGGVLIGAMSFTGVGVSDTTSSATGTGTAWSSGTATNAQADSVYIGGSGSEDITNPTTSTPTSGTEVHDIYWVTDQQGMTSGYKIVSTIASDAITGNLSNANSTANTGALVIYKAASVSVSAPNIPNVIQAW